MTYRELLELTKKHPNPFWNKKQHDIEFEYKYRIWVERQNHKFDPKDYKTKKL